MDSLLLLIMQYKDFLLHYIPEQQAYFNKCIISIVLYIIFCLIMLIILPTILNKLSRITDSTVIIVGIIYSILISLTGAYLCDKCVDPYDENLYKYYDEYQPYITEVIHTPKSKDGTKYTLIITKENMKTQIDLKDSSSEFIERIDEQSPKNYYELHRNEQNQKLVLIKYIGTKEQTETEKKQVKKIYES